jgi:hypothetical protein
MFRAGLSAVLAVLDEDPPQTRQAVRRVLGHWRQNPALGGLRDEGDLARLPDAERQACRDLWAAVGAVLQRARQPPPG